MIKEISFCEALKSFNIFPGNQTRPETILYARVNRKYIRKKTSHVFGSHGFCREESFKAETPAQKFQEREKTAGASRIPNFLKFLKSLTAHRPPENKVDNE